MHVGDVGSTLVPSSYSTLVLERLLIRLFVHLEGSPLNMLGVPPASTVDPPIVPTSNFGTPKTQSIIPPSAPASEYGILRLRV